MNMREVQEDHLDFAAQQKLCQHHGFSKNYFFKTQESQLYTISELAGISIPFPQLMDSSGDVFAPYCVSNRSEAEVPIGTIWIIKAGLMPFSLNTGLSP
jgi:hypothetical protein